MAASAIGVAVAVQILWATASWRGQYITSIDVNPAPTRGHAQIQTVRVAIYRSDSDPNAPVQLRHILEGDASIHFECHVVDSEDIKCGELHSYDVLIIGGGQGSHQGRELGEAGRGAVRRFVKEGGGYVGICAGAFLAASGQTWTLNLVEVKTLTGLRVVNGAQVVALDARGTGKVLCEMHTAGAVRLRVPSGTYQMQYSGGPIFVREPGSPSEATIETLATFASEIASHEIHRGTMINTPAVISSRYGRGLVVLFSPHPDFSMGLEPLVCRAAYACADPTGL